MSRCFPYPPPGYVRNGVRDGALIESIKREVEKAKKERRKERKREKKEKKAALDSGGIKDKKHSHKRRNGNERSQDDHKAGDHRKKRNDDTEHLEKSNLTEEHGKPVNSLNSTDSTMNSSKKQKQVLPPEGQNPASIIRIRLPLQRHKDPEMLPIGEQSCSAPVRTDVFGCEKHDHAPRSSTDRIEHLCSTSWSADEGSAYKLGLTEQRPFSGVAETSLRKNGTSSSRSLDDRGLSPSEMKYENLIENWVPPSFHSGCADFEDQEWLFERKQLNGDTGKCKADYDSLTYGSPSLWPRMHYLPEVDMYALPYTVPY